MILQMHNKNQQFGGVNMNNISETISETKVTMSDNV